MPQLVVVALTREGVTNIACAKPAVSSVIESVVAHHGIILAVRAAVSA